MILALSISVCITALAAIGNSMAIGYLRRAVDALTRTNDAQQEQINLLLKARR